MSELNIDYVMTGVVSLFLFITLYFLAKPTLDTMKQDEEERNQKKLQKTPTLAQ